MTNFIHATPIATGNLHTPDPVANGWQRLARCTLLQAVQDVRVGDLGLACKALAWLNGPDARDIADGVGLVLPERTITSELLRKRRDVRRGYAKENEFLSVEKS